MNARPAAARWGLGALAQSLDDLSGSLHDLASEVRSFGSELKRVASGTERLEAWKTGAADPTKGVDVRLDRVERDTEAMRRLAWIILVAVLGLVIQAMAGIVTGRPGLSVPAPRSGGSTP